MVKPVLIVFAGPNGSGKTTLRKTLQQHYDLGFHINPDEIAEELDISDPYQLMRAAQKQADELREDCLQKRISFSFETVFSHPSKLDFLIRTKNQGYFVIVHYVALENANLNINRVATRVQLGGHDVPEDKIRQRFYRSLQLLDQIRGQVDQLHLWDNSFSDRSHKYVLRFESGKAFTEQGSEIVMTDDEKNVMILADFNSLGPEARRISNAISILARILRTEHGVVLERQPLWVYRYFWVPFFALKTFEDEAES